MVENGGERCFGTWRDWGDVFVLRCVQTGTRACQRLEPDRAYSTFWEEYQPHDPAPADAARRSEMTLDNYVNIDQLQELHASNWPSSATDRNKTIKYFVLARPCSCHIMPSRMRGAATSCSTGSNLANICSWKFSCGPMLCCPRGCLRKCSSTVRNSAQVAWQVPCGRSIIILALGGG